MVPTVLVVDDIADHRLLVRTVLDDHGYETREADGGDAALAVLLTEHLDLVLADVSMPEMDGYELARRIRADVTLHGVPIVLYTAQYLAPDVVTNAAAVGAHRIVKKTGDLDELLDAVADALRPLTSGHAL